MKKYDQEIVIYDKRDGLIAHMVETIEQASEWIGCSLQALYKSLHLNGEMIAKGYKVEKIIIDQDGETV